MRINGCYGLKWCNVDFDSGIIKNDIFEPYTVLVFSVIIMYHFLQTEGKIGIVGGIVMSLYYFIAGNRPIERFCRGIQYRNRNMIIIEDEDTILNIFEDTNNVYSNVYTSLPYIMDIEIGRNYRNIEQDLLSYIRKTMETHQKIELWSTWMIWQRLSIETAISMN